MIRIAIGVCLVLLVGHLWRAWYCIASVWTTVLIYVGLFASVWWSTGRLRGTYRERMRFGLGGFVIALFLGELLLRITGTYAAYSEQNGRGRYYSNYPAHRHNWSRVFHSEKLSDEWLNLPPAGSKQEAGSEFSYMHHYNRWRLRDRDITWEKPANELRIFGLGDSFTEGIGTPDDSTWTRLLESSLQAADTVHRIRTLNAGRSGADPCESLVILREVLLPMQPDVVVLALNSSDIMDFMMRGGTERFLPQRKLYRKFFANPGRSTELHDMASEKKIITLPTAEGYDQWAEIYETNGNPLMALDTRAIGAHFNDIRAGEQVVDLGCGTGRLTWMLADAGAVVTALDASEGMLAHARERCGDAVRFIVHDFAKPLPLPDGSFDKAISTLVLEHLPDLGLFFGELARISRTGATMYISAMHPAMLLRGAQANFTDPDTGVEIRPMGYPHQVSDFVNAILGAGLEITRITEGFVDEALARDYPKAEKYMDWAMHIAFLLKKG